MSDQRVTRGFAWNHLYKMVEYGLVNLYTILVVRKFGPELTGNYAVYLSISGTLAIVAAFGVDGVLLRFLPRIAQGELKIGEWDIGGVRPFLAKLAAFRFFVTIVLCTLVLIAFVALPALIPSYGHALGGTQRLWPFLIIFLIGQAGVAFATFTMIGLLQIKWVFFASLITRLALLGAGLYIILSGALSIDYAVGLHAIAAVLNASILLIWLHRKIYREESPGLRKELRGFISHLAGFVRKPSVVRVFLYAPFMIYGLTTWGSDLLSTVLGRQPDIIMMRGMLGENAKDIGLYQAAAQLVLMTEYIFLFGLGGTLVSVFSELAHQDELTSAGGRKVYARLGKARRDIAGFQGITTAPLFAFVIVFAPMIVELLYGPKFMSAVPMIVLGIAIVSITVVGFGGGMQVTSLVVIGKERLVFRNRLAWGLANLVANYFLIRSWGALGAMVGTQLANAGACTTESYFARKLIGPSMDLKKISVLLLIIGSAVGIAYVLVQFASDVPLLFRVILAGATTGSLTLLGYYLLRLPDARRVFDRLRALRSGKKPALSN